MKKSGYIKDLINLAKIVQGEGPLLPFSVYSSTSEQQILNTPIVKPLLIFVLSGIKKLGVDGELVCPAGCFVFLSNKSGINMRNIPVDKEYLAILVDFEYSDFNQFKPSQEKVEKRFSGEIDYVLARTMHQYMEWSAFAYPEAWHFRKKELLQIIYQSGYEQVSSMAAPPTFSHQLHNLIHEDISGDWNINRLTAKLAISESSFRRKLKAEETDIHLIVNSARLGSALHLLQTTLQPIGLIAERCGYISHSRFTEKFKKMFGITPSELRKTRIRI